MKEKQKKKQNLKPSKQAESIFKAIEPRLKELWIKLVSGRYNKATQLAFWVGFVSDIDQALDK